VSAHLSSEDVRSMINANIVETRLAAILYTPEGKEIIDQLWEETLAEFSFAHIPELLRSLA